ncbi:mechanosensitive ion channel family protein [Paenibacillus albiflavus]|uniref:Mechanosensitive ion channel family protein n=1 Tax=Paenibacillus albiflavus TaxID=2545760 RepID=A0A4R4ECJ4_9BACL|nr:mechanosensitive ion channel family protein [Paenibacillus albiflavus]TCZ75675.1 mechanosensitive ion channel family protein [Paenibacillus albiflavus]
MNLLETYWAKFVDYTAELDIIGHGFRIILIYILARVVITVADKAIDKVMKVRDRSKIQFDTRRGTTISKLIHNCISYTVNFIAILLILSQFGINLGPIIAGAGVLGLAIGFGAQSLVKDVITGFFIIFEDQFAVGDVIQIGAFKGTVEQIGLRVTRVKSSTGEVQIIPNGTIAQVTNFSVYNSVAVVDVSIDYGANLDCALKVLNELAMRMYNESELIVSEPKVLGIQTLDSSAVVMRTTVECLPNRQTEVTRVMLAEIKKEFDHHEISLT